MRSRWALSLLLLWIVCTTGLSDLVILKCDRRVDLRTHIVRVTTSLKVENTGPDGVSEFLVTLPNFQAKNLAYLKAFSYDGKGKSRNSISVLPVDVVQRDGIPADITVYSISLPKKLVKGENLNFDILSVFTHFLQPFPEEITQADFQLVLYQDTASYLSPYEVKFQSVTLQFPSPRVESYTKLPDAKLVESELKYGPYENLPPFSFTPIMAHYENNQPFVVAKTLVREIEVSHWGNVQVTEHYSLVHGGARNKGGFSRIEYQARPDIRGASSFRHLVARLPPRAHSIYYRDEIGNISTSNLWADSRKIELKIEPRYPMFGGWKTAFTIGYGLPLQDFLFDSEGKRVLNFSFGCPVDEVVIDDLVLKVVLPEGSKDILVHVPFHTNQHAEIKFSNLDFFGRPVVVLKKANVVPEHNQYFQVNYKFNSLSMLQEPIMLISGFFFLFVAFIMFKHVDVSISKSSATYIAKLQWEEVQAAVQHVQTVVNRCVAVDEKLEASLHELSRTGDVQTCKAARKTADGVHKGLLKELKPTLGFLQSSTQAVQIWPKVEELVAKEREKQEKLLVKHTTVVDGYEKKSSGRDLANRVSALDQRLAILNQEVDELLDAIDQA